MSEAMKHDELIERLNGKVRVPISDGLGKVCGNAEPDNEDFFVRQFPASPLATEAATALTEQAAVIKRLRKALDRAALALKWAERRLPEAYHEVIQNDANQAEKALQETSDA